MIASETRAAFADVRFYNRSAEMNVVKKAFEVDSTTAGHPQQIINFYGVSGSGKSSLVKRLRENYPYSFLSAAAHLSSQPELSAQEFLKHILAGVSKQVQDILPADLQRPIEGTVQELQTYLEKILDCLNKREGTHILLLFDDYDACPRSMREIFESSVLSTIIKYQCAAAVLTSRSNVSFQGQQQPALSFHTRYRELGTFSPDVVEGEYNEYLQIVPYILRVTAGLPVCVERMIQQIHARNITTVTQFLKHEKELVQRNYDELVRNRIFKDVDSELHDVIDVLAIPRRLNISVMSNLLPRIARFKSRYQNFTHVDYLELIDDLGYLAPWSPVRNGYSIQHSVRHIISYYMKLIHFEEFIRVNSMLLNMYEEQINVPAPKVHDLVESLYHKLIIIRVEKGEYAPRESISAEFSMQVENYFTQYEQKSPSIDALNELKETLVNDSEMKEYIDEDTRETMERLLKASDSAAS